MLVSRGKNNLGGTSEEENLEEEEKGGGRGKGEGGMDQMMNGLRFV